MKKSRAIRHSSWDLVQYWVPAVGLAVASFTSCRGSYRIECLARLQDIPHHQPETVEICLLVCTTISHYKYCYLLPFISSLSSSYARSFPALLAHFAVEKYRRLRRISYSDQTCLASSSSCFFSLALVPSLSQTQSLTSMARSSSRNVMVASRTWSSVT